MENDDVINLNVLCPWSCSTSCRDAGTIPLDLMFQKILPKIQILLFTDKEKYRQVQFSWNQYMSEDYDYPNILLNDKWPINPSIKIDRK